MRFFTKALITFFLILFSAYLLLPAPSFPVQPPDSVQSLEDADTETPLRRAYFTNFTRQQVLEHYQRQFSRSSLLSLPLLTYRLNYPPEEAFSLIRDQTRSTFLEEMVHPMRESFFVNGFEPKQEKDDIWYKGKHYEQKITVKYVPSSVFVRLPVMLAALFALGLVAKEWFQALRSLVRDWFAKPS